MAGKAKIRIPKVLKKIIPKLPIILVIILGIILLLHYSQTITIPLFNNRTLSKNSSPCGFGTILQNNKCVPDKPELLNKLIDQGFIKDENGEIVFDLSDNKHEEIVDLPTWYIDWSTLGYKCNKTISQGLCNINDNNCNSECICGDCAGWRGGNETDCTGTNIGSGRVSCKESKCECADGYCAINGICVSPFKTTKGKKCCPSCSWISPEFKGGCSGSVECDKDLECEESIVELPGIQFYPDINNPNVVLINNICTSESQDDCYLPTHQNAMRRQAYVKIKPNAVSTFDKLCPLVENTAEGENEYECAVTCGETFGLYNNDKNVVSQVDCSKRCLPKLWKWYPVFEELADKSLKYTGGYYQSDELMRYQDSDVDLRICPSETCKTELNLPEISQFQNCTDCTECKIKFSEYTNNNDFVDSKYDCTKCKECILDQYNLNGTMYDVSCSDMIGCNTCKKTDYEFKIVQGFDNKCDTCLGPDPNVENSGCKVFTRDPYVLNQGNISYHNDSVIYNHGGDPSIDYSSGYDPNSVISSCDTGNNKKTCDNTLIIDGTEKIGWGEGFKRIVADCTKNCDIFRKLLFHTRTYNKVGIQYIYPPGDCYAKDFTDGKANYTSACFGPRFLDINTSGLGYIKQVVNTDGFLTNEQIGNDINRFFITDLGHLNFTDEEILKGDFNDETKNWWEKFNLILQPANEQGYKKNYNNITNYFKTMCIESNENTPLKITECNKNNTGIVFKIEKISDSTIKKYGNRLDPYDFHFHIKNSSNQYLSVTPQSDDYKLVLTTDVNKAAAWEMKSNFDKQRYVNAFAKPGELCSQNGDDNWVEDGIILRCEGNKACGRVGNKKYDKNSYDYRCCGEGSDNFQFNEWCSNAGEDGYACGKNGSCKSGDCVGIGVGLCAIRVDAGELCGGGNGDDTWKQDGHTFMCNNNQPCARVGSKHGTMDYDYRCCSVGSQNDGLIEWCRSGGENGFACGKNESCKSGNCASGRCATAVNAGESCGGGNGDDTWEQNGINYTCNNNQPCARVGSKYGTTDFDYKCCSQGSKLHGLVEWCISGSEDGFACGTDQSCKSGDCVGGGSGTGICAIRVNAGEKCGGGNGDDTWKQNGMDYTCNNNQPCARVGSKYGTTDYEYRCCSEGSKTHGLVEWCVNSVENGFACGTDSNCKSGQCEGGGTGTGVCATPLPPGSDCSGGGGFDVWEQNGTTYMCEGNKACAQFTDNNYKCCPNGSIPSPVDSQEWCVGVIENGDRCPADSTCKSGQCVGGRALGYGICAIPLPPGSDCSGGGGFDTWKQNGTTYMCEGNKACAQFSDNNYKCCPNGTVDSVVDHEEWCVGVIENGDRCPTDSTCKSGRCVGGGTHGYGICGIEVGVGEKCPDNGDNEWDVNGTKYACRHGCASVGIGYGDDSWDYEKQCCSDKGFVWSGAQGYWCKGMSPSGMACGSDGACQNNECGGFGVGNCD